MGTSYEGLLVVGDLEVVVEALADGGVTAYVAIVAPGRVAVIPKGDRWNVADVAPVAVLLSGRYGLPVLAHEMYDSDRLWLYVYDHGEVIHEYISEMDSVGDVQETDEGFTRTVDGVIYDMDDPAAPTGPRGADPDKLVPFGVGTIDRVRLGEVLVSSDDYGAEGCHEMIAEALNLDPEPLTVAYHWFERGYCDVDAIHVTPR